MLRGRAWGFPDLAGILRGPCVFAFMFLDWRILILFDKVWSAMQKGPGAREPLVQRFGIKGEEA